ncbi:MAG: hypothetical protein AB7N91_07675 [Candidatus Tectimicrobiota bacterium]
MPNLVTFRDDPDSMLVMVLEHYDERMGLAEKAVILHHDMVGCCSPLTAVSSTEAGLFVSLDQRGAVDLPYIATLYGPNLAKGDFLAKYSCSEVKIGQESARHADDNVYNGLLGGRKVRTMYKTAEFWCRGFLPTPSNMQCTAYSRICRVQEYAEYTAIRRQ